MWKLLTLFSPHFECFKSFSLHNSFIERLGPVSSVVWFLDLSEPLGVWISSPQIVKLSDLQMTAELGGHPWGTAGCLGKHGCPISLRSSPIELFLPELLTSVFNTKTNVSKSQWGTSKPKWFKAFESITSGVSLLSNNLLLLLQPWLLFH